MSVQGGPPTWSLTTNKRDITDSRLKPMLILILWIITFTKSMDYGYISNNCKGIIVTITHYVLQLLITTSDLSRTNQYSTWILRAFFCSSLHMYIAQRTNGDKSPDCLLRDGQRVDLVIWCVTIQLVLSLISVIFVKLMIARRSLAFVLESSTKFAVVLNLRERFGHTSMESFWSS